MNEWLTTKQFEVHTFTKSSALIDALSNHEPEIILLDVLLPEAEDGKSVCMELRNKHHFSKRIYLFSTKPLSEKEVSRIGADAFIEKPFDIQTLLEMLSNTTTDKYRKTGGALSFKL